MRGLSLALSCVVGLSLLSAASLGLGGSGEVVPVVETSSGKVSGLKEVSTNGKSFYSYYSIPYAKPPLGELRFKEPVKVEEPWEGVREGISQPPPCPQIPLLSLITGGVEVVGQEDCLYLNVFTPKPMDEAPLLPVMVFIHGGAWVSGGAKEYPPHVLLNHDVVLVTLQYRLGLLGFLSTEDDVAPGNLGLKDQTLGLSWVQANAPLFGGDPLRITIFGESAGAGSVHFQMLSHKSIGLFRRAILQSGNALCPWSLGAAHAKVAKYTGRHFNCSIPDSGTSTSEDLIQCLQGVAVNELVPIHLHFKEWYMSPLLVGPRVDGNYIAADPAQLMKEARHKRIDLISGITRHEGALITLPMYGNEILRSSLQYNLARIGPVSLEFGPGDISPLNQTIKIFDHYLGGVNLNAHHADNVTRLYTDRFFSVCHDLTSAMHAQNVARYKKKTYQYELTHRGQRSFSDIFNLTVGQHWVSHMDDMPYLFTGGPLWQPLDQQDDLGVRDIITKLWTNFADSGDPTPDDSLGFKWEPVTKDHFRHLVLQPEPVMEDDYRNQTREFWASLPLKQNLILHPEKVLGLVYLPEEEAEAEAGTGTEKEKEEEKEEEGVETETVKQEEEMKEKTVKKEDKEAKMDAEDETVTMTTKEKGKDQKKKVKAKEDGKQKEEIENEKTKTNKEDGQQEKEARTKKDKKQKKQDKAARKDANKNEQRKGGKENKDNKQKNEETEYKKQKNEETKNKKQKNEVNKDKTQKNKEYENKGKEEEHGKKGKKSNKYEGKSKDEHKTDEL